MKRSSAFRLRTIQLLGLQSIFVCAAWGQDQPVPHQPILGRVPDAMLYSVTFKYKDNVSSAKTAAPTPPSTPRIAVIQTEKTGSVYRQITTMTDGAKRESWNVHGEQVCKNVYTNSYIHLNDGNPLYVDFKSGDFSELSWIGMDNYVGAKGEQKTFMFSAKNSERRQTETEKEEYALQSLIYRNSADGKLIMAERASYVKKELDQYIKQKFGDTESHVTLDIATQLPLEYDDGKIIRTYTYSNNIEPLSVPAVVIQTIQRWAALTKSTTVHPSPP